MPGAGHVGEGTWPLTGRLDEMDRIRRSLAGGDQHSLMLVGPAGVGKTRLAREAQRIAREAGHDAVWLSATHSIARTPLGVFAPLLPAADGPGDLLTRSARAVLDRPRDGGLVLLVDDAHLLDDLSAGLIHQLAAAHGVHVVLTVRSGEAVPEPVTALWKDDVVRRVELGQLGDAAVGALLGSVLGGQVDPEAIRVLAHRCAGNALLLRELTLSALAAGALTRHLGLWRLVGSLPPSDRIVELMGARLEGLSDEAVRLLEGVAYAEPLGSAELADIAVPGLVDRLQRQGLLTSSLVGRRVEVRLAHPLVGEVMRSRTSAVRVAEMARALADLTEQAGARRAEDALRLGIWRLDGGGGSSAVMLRAAAAARWHYDFVLAERLARAAGSFEGGLLAAQALALQGRSLEAAREFEALEPTTSTDDERVRLATAHIDLLWLCLGDMDDGQRVAERAEASIEDPVRRGVVSAKRAGIVLGAQGPGPAAAISVPLLAVAQGPSFVFSSLVSTFSLGRQGRTEAAVAVADRGYLAARELEEPDDWYPWFLVHSRCEALAYAGRFAEAEADALAQYQEGLDAGSSEQRAWFLWHLSRARLERGQTTSAARDAREAVALLTSLGRLGIQHSMLSLLAKALAVSGDARGAQEALDTIAALGIDQPRWSFTEFLSAHAWTAVASGRLAVARSTLRTAVEVGEEVGDLTGALSALHDLARLGQARLVLVPFEEMASGMDGELAGVRVAHVRALAADDAAGLSAAATGFAGLGADLLAAEASAAAASSWRAAGDGHRADAELRRAGVLLSACERVQTPTLSALVEPDRLTVAERETALLAARGRTSKQIAEELVLSVRTVENRLQRVYQKLGIRKRAELADLIG